MRNSTASLTLIALGMGASAGTWAAHPDPSAFSAVWWTKAPINKLVPVDGKPIPFTAQGAKRYQDNISALKHGSLVDEADYSCVPQGMPRAMTSAYPFEIFSASGWLLFAHEQNRSFRLVQFTDQHQDPKIWDPSYMGQGIASWDGNDLVIDSVNYKSDAIFIDSTGLPASSKLHLIEHLRLLDGGKQLQDSITIDDPDVFTKPWVVRFVFARRDDVKVRMDWICGESHRPLMAATGAPSKAPAAAPPALSAAQQALSGYWHSAVRWSPQPTTNVPAASPDASSERSGFSPALLTPAAMARNQAEQAAAAGGKTTFSASALCLPSAVAGSTVAGIYESAILVEPNDVAFLTQENSTMRIAYIGQQHPANVTPSWMGDSVARWDGDTLVVDTIGFNGKNLIPIRAAYVPTGPNTHIVERYKILADGRLQDEATFDDPDSFTKSFTVPSFYVKGTPFQEYICQENNLEGGYPTVTGKPKAPVFGGSSPSP